MEEDKDGQYFWCPINCLPLKGKWQRLVYEAIGDDDLADAITTKVITQRIKDDHHADVRPQYLSRALQALLRDGHIVETESPHTSAKSYVRKVGQFDIEVSAWSPKFAEQLLTCIALANMSHDTHYHLNPNEYPEIVARVMSLQCDYLDDLMPEHLYKRMYPNVELLKRTVYKWSKGKGAERLAGRSKHPQYKGIIGLNRERLTARLAVLGEIDTIILKYLRNDDQ